MFTNTVPTDAYRGAGRPEATYAIERAVDALARKLGKDPVEMRRAELHPRVPGDDRVGADDRLRRLRRVARRRARAVRLRRRAGRAAGAPRRRASAKRLGIGLSTYVEMCGLAPSAILGAIRYCGRRLGGGDDPLPADRHGAGADRVDAARPGSRDVVVADRRRPARLRASTRSRCCTATRPSSRSAWTRTAAAASPSAASRCTTPPRRSSRRRRRSPRT